MKTLTTLIVFLFSTAMAQGALLFSENFETQTLNQWPSGWFGFGGNDSDHSVNRIELDPTDPTNKVFRLTGRVGSYWGAGADYPVNFTDHFRIDLRLYNDGQTLPASGHKFKGAVQLRQGHRWTNQGLIFVEFWKTNQVKIVGEYVYPYNNAQWYDMSIEYERIDDNDFQVNYTIDDFSYGPVVIPFSAIGNANMDHLELVSAAGSTYFDDVTVTSIEDTIPEPASSVLLGFCLVALLFGSSLWQLRS